MYKTAISFKNGKLQDKGYSQQFYFDEFAISAEINNNLLLVNNILLVTYICWSKIYNFKFIDGYRSIILEKKSLITQYTKN